MTGGERGPEQEPGPRESPVKPEGKRPDPPPRIYVASLSDYNAGRLHGQWIDASHDLEDIQEQVHAMLARSPEPVAEEWAIHDYEGFGPLHLDEYAGLGTVAKMAAGIVEHGEAFAYWANDLDSTELEESLDRFDDRYLGSFGSRSEFAEEYLEMSGIDPEEFGPEELRPYISFDFDAYARDLSYDYRVVENAEGQVYVFDRE